MRTAVPPRHLPACPPPRRLDVRNVATQPPRSFSPPSRSPSSLVLSSPSTPERSRRHRSPLPWPPASPRLPDTLPSSASTPSTSSSSHAPPDALHRRRRCLLHHRRRRSTSPPSPSIRRTQDVPEHTGLLCESAVSPSSFPLTSLSRACPVAAAPRAPEAAVRHGRRAPCPRAPPPRVVAPTCSCCLVATTCALRSLERELQPHARAIPSSGRRRELCSGELRPPQLLPSAPPDAREPGLRPGALRRHPRGRYRGHRRVPWSPATTSPSA